MVRMVKTVMTFEGQGAKEFQGCWYYSISWSVWEFLGIYSLHEIHQMFTYYFCRYVLLAIKSLLEKNGKTAPSLVVAGSQQARRVFEQFRSTRLCVSILSAHMGTCSHRVPLYLPLGCPLSFFFRMGINLLLSHETLIETGLFLNDLTQKCMKFNVK